MFDEYLPEGLEMQNRGGGATLMDKQKPPRSQSHYSKALPQNQIADRYDPNFRVDHSAHLEQGNQYGIMHSLDLYGRDRLQFND